MYLADAFIFGLCRKSQGTHGFCFLWGVLATLRGTGHLFVSRHRHFVQVAKEMD